MCPHECALLWRPAKRLFDLRRPRRLCHRGLRFRRGDTRPVPFKNASRSINEIVHCVVPAPERLGIVAPSFANQGFCGPRVRREADCPSEPVAVNYAHDAKPIVAEVDTVDSWGFGQTFSFWPHPHPRSAGVKVEIDSALRDRGSRINSTLTLLGRWDGMHFWRFFLPLAALLHRSETAWVSSLWRA